MYMKILKKIWVIINYLPLKYSHTNSDECFKDLQKYSIFVDEGTSTNGGNQQ